MQTQYLIPPEVPQVPPSEPHQAGLLQPAHATHCRAGLTLAGCGWQRWRTLFSCTGFRRPMSRCDAGSYATSVIARADHVEQQLWRPSPHAGLGLGKTQSTLPRQNPVSSTGPSQGCTTSVNSAGEAVCCGRHQQPSLTLCALSLLLALLLH